MNHCWDVASLWSLPLEIIMEKCSEGRFRTQCVLTFELTHVTFNLVFKINLLSLTIDNGIRTKVMPSPARNYHIMMAYKMYWRIVIVYYHDEK